MVHDGRPLACGISLSHRAGWALCTLAPPGVHVGCDLEQVEPRSPGFVADFLTTRERSLVAAWTGDPAECANLVWSAKESAVKLLGTGWRVPARTVEVIEAGAPLPRAGVAPPSDPAPCADDAHAPQAPDDPEAWAELVVDSPIGRLRGGWHRQAAQVVTWLTHPTDRSHRTDRTRPTDTTVREVAVWPSSPRRRVGQSGSGSASAAWAAANRAIGTRKGEHET